MSTITLQEAFDFAIQQHKMGNLAAAETLYQRILSLSPQNPDVLNLLGLIAHETGRNDRALELIKQAVDLKPSSALFHHNYGLVLLTAGNYDSAIAAFRRAISIQPDYAMAFVNLGVTLTRTGRFNDAVLAYQETLRIRPDYSLAYSQLAMAHCHLGSFEEFLRCFQRALELSPDSAQIRSDFLVFLQYMPSITSRRLFQEHLEYERKFAAPLRRFWRPHTNPVLPERTLRLGFISPHFSHHPVGYLIIALLENLVPEDLAVFCYSDTPRSDPMNARIKAAASSWADIIGTSDQNLCDRVRADEIDILFDLAGHTAGNRLLTFARKPAPVQITWLDYVGTTGLSAMDYILADSQEIPLGAEADYSEAILRMPNDYICFAPPTNSPPVGHLPASVRGFVTFASFNLMAKTSPEAIDAWIRILERLPHSRLLLKNSGWTEPVTQERLIRRFTERGIAPDRIQLQDWSPHAELLSSYNEVDIALDTFPYNGGLTTCEALWMGVPVITCPHDTFAGRHGLTHLTAAGLTEVIARDVNHYVELAVSLAHDLDRLASLRSQLRKRIEESALCDGPQFAKDFSSLMRAVWRQWCKRQKS